MIKLNKEQRTVLVRKITQNLIEKYNKEELTKKEKEQVLKKLSEEDKEKYKRNERFITEAKNLQQQEKEIRKFVDNVKNTISYYVYDTKDVIYKCNEINDNMLKNKAKELNLISKLDINNLKDKIDETLILATIENNNVQDIIDSVTINLEKDIKNYFC